MIDKQAEALKKLGKIHAYTTFLIKEGMLTSEHRDQFCNRFYAGHPEIKYPFKIALTKAIDGRKKSFDRDKAILKSSAGG